MGIADLGIFVGTWNTTGEMLATASQPATRLVATDTYRWLAGEKFMLHDVDARLGNDVSRLLEIIGWDEGQRRFTARSYDDQGGIEDFTATLIERRWQIFGETTRFDGMFSADGKRLTGQWERREPGAEWAAWMTIELRRAY
jgi:hypothetical protein